MAATTILGEENSESWLSFSPDRDIWHQDAPPAIRLGYQSLDDEPSWGAWVKHLRQRRRPVPLHKILPGGKSSLLLASEVDDEEGPPAVQLLSFPKDSSQDVVGRAKSWLDQSITAECTTQELLEALAWCHALPDSAALLPVIVWWRLLGRLIDLNASAREIEPTEAPLAWQILGGELALSLAYLFPELQARDDWQRTGRETIDQGIEELLSPEGVPHASHLRLFGELVACWTRAGVLCNELSQTTWEKSQRKAYVNAVLALARLTRSDESGELETVFGTPVSKALLKAAARAADKPKCFAAVARALGKSDRSSALPDCSLNSERAQTALLRRSWKTDAPRLAVTYAHRRVETELFCGEVVWSGQWQIELARDHRSLSIESAWEEVCAESDEDVDYIELEARFAEGVRVQRHMLLAKEDRLLFLADAVISEQTGAIDYCGILPLAAGISTSYADETVELRLLAQKSRVQLLPLGLSEWRSERRPGTLGVTDRGLELRQSGSGPCLFAPLLIDLKRKRIDKPLTWRQLTVAEHRQIIPPGDAVGYRIQLGKRQWLVYRSLARLGTRSVLGQNLANEFLFARFLPENGESETLLEIEP